MNRKLWLMITLVYVVSVILCGMAVAEGIDLDSLSVKELLDLQTQLDHKIVELSPYENCVLYEGKYIAGKEFEPGTYVFDCVSVRENTFHQCYVHLYCLDKDTGEYVENETIWGANLYLDEKLSATLEENDMIEIEDGILVAHMR